MLLKSRNDPKARSQIKEMEEPSSYWCEHCATPFSSKKGLAQHQTRTQICMKYKSVIFDCQRCGSYRTLGLKNMDAHLKTCTDTQSIGSPTQHNLSEKVAKLEKDLQTKTSDVTAEKIRSSIYLALLKTHTDIDVDKLVVAEDGVHLFNVDETTKVFLTERHPTNLIDNQPISEGKSRYRRAPKELVIKKEVSLGSAAPPVQEITTPVAEEKTLTIINSCKNLIAQLLNSRVYSKILRELRVSRYKLFGSVSTSEYVKLLQDHTKELEQIFENRQQATRKIRATILTSMTPLDARLLQYPGYTDFCLDAACREKLSESFRRENHFSTDLVPFSLQYLTDRLMNYITVLFPLDRILKWILIHPRGLNNIVYLKLKNSTDADPFSFYLLKKEDRGKRRWDMDCRLEDLTADIISSVQLFLINTYRVHYYGVFSDNKYRPDCMKLSTFIAEDCEQLARNIILLSQPRKFGFRLRKLIVEHCTHNPNDDDRFNMTGDDPLQKRQFAKEETIEMVGTVRQLFDEITDEDAVNFFKSRNVV